MLAKNKYVRKGSLRTDADSLAGPGESRGHGLVIWID